MKVKIKLSDLYLNITSSEVTNNRYETMRTDEMIVIILSIKTKEYFSTTSLFN
tara:strand:- start:1 stop:159 length:159 start_codon:yes stop_codon:yes gene_type:complete